MSYKLKITLFLFLCSISFIYCGPASLGDAKTLNVYHPDWRAGLDETEW